MLKKIIIASSCALMALTVAATDASARRNRGAVEDNLPRHSGVDNSASKSTTAAVAVAKLRGNGTVDDNNNNRRRGRGR